MLSVIKAIARWINSYGDKVSHENVSQSPLSTSNPGSTADEREVIHGLEILENHDTLVVFDEDLLDKARTRWQFGDWYSLAKIDYDSIRHHPDRARIALLVASAHQQLGNPADARKFLKSARDWGISEKLLTRVLISGVYNSIGRGFTLSGKSEKAAVFFEKALSIGSPGSEIGLLLPARQNQQIAQVTGETSSLLINYKFDRSGSQNKLDRRFADTNYLSHVKNHLSQSVVARIDSLNRVVFNEEQLNKLVDRLTLSQVEFLGYLYRKSSLVRQRLSDEYVHIGSSAAAKQFPYKYLFDYPPSSGLLAAVNPKPLRVSFIYSAKKRSAKFYLSLQSLLTAYSLYFKKNVQGLKIDVILCEDVSDDPINVDSLDHQGVAVRRFYLDTGLNWSRSMLLNFGIRQSQAELICFVDVDFLFHLNFFTAFDSALTMVDSSEAVLAVNVFETETSFRDSRIYSAGSPYAYMWVVTRQSLIDVDGFDEGYEGHGFEDRDLEMKLKRVLDLNAISTIFTDPNCFVLHLSHVTRTGEENRPANYRRFQERANESALEDLAQVSWGKVALAQAE